MGCFGSGKNVDWTRRSCENNKGSARSGHGALGIGHRASGTSRHAAANASASCGLWRALWWGQLRYLVTLALVWWGAHVH